MRASELQDAPIFEYHEGKVKDGSPCDDAKVIAGARQEPCLTSVSTFLQNPATTFTSFHHAKISHCDTLRRLDLFQIVHHCNNGRHYVQLVSELKGRDLQNANHQNVQCTYMPCTNICLEDQASEVEH